MKKINFTFSSIIENTINLLQTDNNNSGDDIVMPKLNDLVIEDIKDRNFLYQEDSETYNDVWKSQKYPETEVIFHENSLTFKGRLFISSYIQVDITEGYDFDIRNRSGNFNKNINVICGLIDEPYTGEMGLQMTTIAYINTKLNFSTDENTFRYAQLKLNKVYKRNWNFVSAFDKLKSVIKKNSIRGAKGFGSSGK